MVEEKNQHPMDNNIDDTPMALLEQLVYMENFLQSAGTSPNANPGQTPDTNTSSSFNFNDQLQRELAAFADDTFIFPDEDKNEGSSNHGFMGNGNTNSGINSRNNNDLVSFADATSFDHMSPSVPTSNGPPISNQTYQNLNNRYANKRKFDYHDTMQNNSNTSIGNIQTNTNVNPPTQHHQQNQAPSPIPSTIHELLGKKSSNSSSSSSSFNPSLLARQNQQQQQQQQSGRVHVPEGAQSTLSAAGLSQTQIDALASLVAFHKPEVYQQQQQLPSPQQQQQQHITGGLGANPSIYQAQSLLAQHGRNNSGVSTITASATPLSSILPPQQQQQNNNNNNNNNNLLVNLLAQTLANAVQPNKQQNLLSDLVVALAANQANQNIPEQQQVQQSLPQQQSNDPMAMLQRSVQSPPQFNSSAMVNHHSPVAPSTPQPQLTPTDQTNFHSPIAVTTKQRKRKSPAVKLEESPADSEEEKRLKVTAASARFRQKKKMKEQEMERSLVEAHNLSASLESRIQQLEMENRLLKNLVVEKSQRRDEEEVERLRKKAKTEANRNST